VNPTDWFRVRSPEPFSEEAIAAFRAACAIFKAKVQATLENWESLPVYRKSPKPAVAFFEPESSEDGRVLSLPLAVTGNTLGSRSFLQSAGTRELHCYLPMPELAHVEVGLTEPAFDGPGWRHDWWNPHTDNSISGEEAFRRLGFSLEPTAGKPGTLRVVPGLLRRLQWWLASLRWP
jgi:hypothetical protein